MVYITGDLHGSNDIHKLTNTTIKRAKLKGSISKAPAENDYLIICGDFGLIWSEPNGQFYKEEQYWLNWLSKKPYTILFIDGNHENHNMLDTMPVSNWHGGEVHFVRENIIHLMRGQIYNIEGNTFFTMGGASSHDKEYRIEGISWWDRELPCTEEIDEAIHNLAKYGNRVDYIITHCGPLDLHNKIAPKYPVDDLVMFFAALETKVEYKHWFNGHYHRDVAIDDKHTVVYNKIIPLEKARASYCKGEKLVKGAKIKQINNLTIRYTEACQYAVWSPDGRCLGDRLTLEQAIVFCNHTKDFLKRGVKYEVFEV